MMSPDQEKELLDLLEDYKRIGWLWRAIANLSKWIATVAGATVALYAGYKFMITGR